MNQTNPSATQPPIINRLVHPLALCALAALLCSCAATSVKQVWKSPDCRQPVGKIAVLAIEDRGLVRQGFENRFVRDLAADGATAEVTYDQFALPDIKADKQAAANRLRASGAEALLLVRLANLDHSYRQNRYGNERYASTVTGFDNYNTMGWYDYYTVGLMDMSPTYGNLKQNVYIEASLYDLKTEKRLWAAQTKTVVKENTDRVALMDPLVSKIVEAMKKDGVIQ